MHFTHLHLYAAALTCLYSPSLVCAHLHLYALTSTCMHFPALVFTHVHLYALSCTCIHPRLLVCTHLHLYSLTFTCKHPTGTHLIALLTMSPLINPYIFTVHLCTVSRTMLHLFKRKNNMLLLLFKTD